MASVTVLETTPTPAQVSSPTLETRKVVRDSLVVTIGGQLKRALGTFTALALRWWLDPSRFGVYRELRLFLDNTNRSSLGIGLGAVQEIPILLASGRVSEARYVANVAYTTNTLTCLAYALAIVVWAGMRRPDLGRSPRDRMHLGPRGRGGVNADQALRNVPRRSPPREARSP